MMGFTAPAIAATITPAATAVTTPASIKDPKAEQLISRLNEIKVMDKTEMSKSEKKALRKEVKVIKKELKSSHQGIYLSIGAIIIIILLLILLL
jgi:hypothetical protein